MDSTDAGAVDTLNGLAAACADRSDSFRAAAKAARNFELKALLQAYAEQRARFAAELQEQVRRLGGVPADKGTLAAALYRRWNMMTSAVVGRDDAATVAECQRCEQAADTIYEHVLRQRLPDEAEAVVRQQHTAVREAHDRLRALELVTAG